MITICQSARCTVTARIVGFLTVVVLIPPITRAVAQEKADWQTIRLEPRARAQAVAGTKHGLLVGSDTGELLQFPVDLRDAPEAIASMESAIERIASTQDGDRLAVLGRDGSMRLVSPTTKTQTALPGVIQEPLLDMVVLPDDRVVGIGKSGDRYIWSTSELSSKRLDLSEPVAIAPNGAYAAGWRDGLVVVDLASGEVAYAFQDGAESLSAVSISRTSRLLAAALGARQGLVQVWDLRTGEPLRTLTIPSTGVVRLFFDQSEQELTCIQEDGQGFTVEIGSGNVKKLANTSLPGIPADATLQNMALHSMHVCAIDSSGDLVVPARTGSEFVIEYTTARRGGFVRVPVFVATNRVRSVVPTFFGGFRRFFATLFGIVATVLAVLVFLIFALIYGRNGARYAIAGAGAVLIVLAGGSAIAEIRRFDPATKDMFGSSVGPMSYGVCSVTIPATGRHRGELNSPLRVWIFEQASDPDYHIILDRSDLLTGDALFAQMGERVAGSPKKEAFVFIHGYNVKFEDAVRRTAQLARDIDFPGAAVCFSWPSYGLEGAYVLDVRNADDSVVHLRQFLKDVAAKSGAKRVYVIAHSMGNRVLSQAVETAPAIFQGPDSVFRHFVLAAPDVDKNLFLTRIAPNLAQCQQKTTLYGSSHDWALVMSKRFNGEPRAGDTKPEITCFKGIDSVDCSQLHSSVLDHSYLCEDPVVLSDLFYVISDKPAAERFGMERAIQGKDTFWRIRR